MYQTGLDRHAAKHVPPGGFWCNDCKQPFTSESERTKHREAVHTKPKKAIASPPSPAKLCTDCGMLFAKAIQLRQHRDTKCGQLKAFKCTVCDSSFLTQNTLNVHALIHKGTKSFVCGFCKSSFLSKGQLKVHERSHTGEKPFKCDVSITKGYILLLFG